MFIIGITGGSGSGKTTVVKNIIHDLPKGSVAVISQDSYYKDNGHLSDEEKKRINFDHPASIEFELLNKHIDKLTLASQLRPFMIMLHVLVARKLSYLPYKCYNSGRYSDVYNCTSSQQIQRENLC